MRRLRPRLSYANVVSTIALVFALGGGVVYAAGKIGSSQIAKNAIHSGLAWPRSPRIPPAADTARR